MKTRQVTLFDFDAPPEPPAPKTLQERFLAFHQCNPHVFRAFTEAARQLKARGRKRYGAKAIYEHMRYHMAMQTDDPEGWKLNNSYTSRFARLLLEAYPGEFDDFLETRRLKSE